MEKKVDGYRYEELCAKFLREKGFSDVKNTPKSGDQGVDITAYKNGVKYAVQCKYWDKPVTNKAVQEVVAGMKYYGCKKAIVMTNNTFRPSAKDLAKANDVELWPNIKVAYPGTVPGKGSRSKRANRRLIGLIILLCVIVVVIIVLVRSPIMQGQRRVTGTTTTSVSSEYILPDSDSRYYTESELSDLSSDELRLARNEIYARHGRKFDSTDLQEYFGSQSWYKGTIDPDDFQESSLNEYEKANLDTIMAVEESK